MNGGPYMLATTLLADMPVSWVWIIIVAVSVLSSILKKKDPDKEKGASKSPGPGSPITRSPGQAPRRRVPAARPAERRMAVAPPPPRPVPTPPAPETYTVESLRRPTKQPVPASATIVRPAVGTIDADGAAPSRPHTRSTNSTQAMLSRTIKSRSTLRTAIILSEILAPPKALRNDDI